MGVSAVEMGQSNEVDEGKRQEKPEPVLDRELDVYVCARVRVHVYGWCCEWLRIGIGSVSP